MVRCGAEWKPGTKEELGGDKGTWSASAGRLYKAALRAAIVTLPEADGIVLPQYLLLMYCNDAALFEMFVCNTPDGCGLRWIMEPQCKALPGM
jgi:hypothetical protein